MSDKKPKSCFVIAPIGDETSDTRKRSDDILNYLIKPATVECGYSAVRADEISESGIITRQIIDRILNDDLVIADLTEWNPNVFYEIAIRHCYRKPFIQLMQKGERIPFDLAQNRTIFVDHRDLRSVHESKQILISQIRNIEENPRDIDNPISYAREIKELSLSEIPEDKRFSEILESLSSIQKEISSLGENKHNSTLDERTQAEFDSFRSIIDDAFRRQRTVVDMLELIKNDYQEKEEMISNRTNAALVGARNVLSLLSNISSDNEYTSNLIIRIKKTMRKL